MVAIIQVEQLAKTYYSEAGALPVLKSVDCQIETGDFVAIMGPSGSGKSTFMNLLGCLDRPSSGDYYLDGTVVSSLDTDQLALLRNRVLGFVFQGFNLLPRMNLLDNVALPLVYAGVDRVERQQRAAELLYKVGLQPYALHRPNQISGGQQQRVAIARALVNRPRLLLADEPTGNLDSKTSDEVMRLFCQLNDEGISIVLVTHEPDIAEYAKRLIRFNDGGIVEDETANTAEMAMLIAMFAEAWQAMFSNRLRSFLAMLGMVIGVGAVILMLAIGQGARATVQQSIDSMGSRLFIVLAGPPNSGGVRSGTGGAATLKIADAQALAELDGVNVAAPVVQNNQQLVYGAMNWNSVVFGSSPDYLIARDWTIAEGNAFDESDLRSARRVALIGGTVANNLFGDEPAVGQTIRIGRTPFTVIGVLGSKGQSLDGRDQDDTVIVPLTTAQRHLVGGGPWRNSLRMIIVQARSDEVMSRLEADMTALLRERHRIAEGADNDFQINNLAAIAETAAQMARTMSLLLGAIASVSLVVGGIGIMNIMLVSVTERTREIGIRMAIGARQRDVLSQFLLEALMISFTGGLLGLLVGAGGALLIGQIWQMQVIVSLQAVTLAFVIAAATGIFFGFYPALKASRLDPIEALRYQ